MRPARSRPGARLISLRDAENEYGIPKDTLRKLIERRELRAIEPWASRLGTVFFKDTIQIAK